REQVVRMLLARIRNGELRTGERLAGESRLAQEFNVSRGTIRQALADLQEQQMITTRAGLGSFITFDGAQLDAGIGWARALADSGSHVTTEVRSIEPVSRAALPDLPDDVSLDAGIAIRRVRRTPGGTVVSYECATVPSTGILADIPQTGLVDESLASTLRAAGLVAVRGRQTVGVEPLDDRHAAILEHAVGMPFLRTVRTALDSEGGLVEHVVSLLDPEHFRLELTFGDDA
ncbi:MAG TPA: GntR family transcriptional regulator, partial [Nocardioidaceae bacterium]|nr:GntR family transcriptional regulator [Nocardioidaceae bacterium]